MSEPIGGMAAVNGLQLAYEGFGVETRPMILLIRGLGSQMIAWDDRLCHRLSEPGYFVVRFDNRDIGRSTYLDGDVDLEAVRAGDVTGVPYTLDDMSDDVLGLLDWFDVGSAHLVGLSMGGMIAQLTAIRAPDRVRSLTSIMSMTGSGSSEQRTPEAEALLEPALPVTRASYQDAAVETLRVCGSPGYPFEEDEIRELAGRSYDRGYDPSGVNRQLAAVYASPDRTVDLRMLSLPALVVHGTADALIPPGEGAATARAIPGAELLMLEGMGHDLPQGVWTDLAASIHRLVARAENS